ncbi:MAG: hypothetical protein MUF54_12845 [Polyangiaceae bacterium]|jgi:hypothetical protein|nr:hypothetical protein [Polyangiaceae bacterium]
MPTTYLWQQRLLNNKPVDGGADAAVRASDERRMHELLCEVETCKQDVQRMVDIIRRYLDDFPPEHRRAVALHIYGASQGQGAFFPCR